MLVVVFAETSEVEDKLLEYKRCAKKSSMDNFVDVGSQCYLQPVSTAQRVRERMARRTQRA